MLVRSTVVAAWSAAVLLVTAVGFDTAPESEPWVGQTDGLVAQGSMTQGAMAQGAMVTFAAVRGDKERHSERARLLSLAVERGETPTPFLPVGAFRATYQAVLTLPARDRINFLIDGRGKVELSINGKAVLDGAVSLKRSLQTKKAVRLKKGGNDIKIVFESAARGDGQFRVFWSGVDFGFEPIAPELLSYVASDEAVLVGEQLRLGHQLFVERRCARCHEYDERRTSESAYLELDRSGPDLRLAGARVQGAWIAKWLRDPHAIRPDASMPKFALADSEILDVATYIASLGEPRGFAPLTSAQVEAGAKRFRELGCVACHARTDESVADAAFGKRIHLGFVKEKWYPAALATYLQDPAAHFADVRMPNLSISAGDAASLAAYLLEGAVTSPPIKGNLAKGRRLVREHNCKACHAFDSEIPPVDRAFPRFRNLKPERGCLSDKPSSAGAPDHNFSKQQREALREFLPFAAEVPFRRSPVDYVARHVTAERCVACHALDGMPSVWAQLSERWSEDEPLPVEQDPVAQGVPSLTWVGAKLQPSWIQKFVIGQLPSPRPWLTARMPKFAKHGNAIAAGLVREHGYTSEDEPVRSGGANLAMHGARLIEQGSGFGCVQCHAVGDNKATQVFEREGINLVTARRRLRHEYYTRWLADPTRLDPDARMPKYADNKGKTAFTDVLGGKAADQFEAIWQHLGDKAK